MRPEMRKGGWLKRVFAGSLLAVLLGSGAPAAEQCGAGTDGCETATGFYHAELPDGKAAGMVVFLHGYGGSGEGVLKMRRMVDGLKARGYAVIAPTAERRNGGNRSWVFYPGWEGRDEKAFLHEVVSDAAARFDLDQSKTVLAGFSAGGFMVNYLACAAPESFPAYAPVSGGFWRPMPESCRGPVKLLHAHGWRDGVVPLEGRILGGGRWEQGDIFAGLGIWREANGCVGHKPDRMWETEGFMRRNWSKCAPGGYLEFALFPGGHQVPKGWSDLLADWLETRVFADPEG